jgi:hypothetical protein
MRVTNHEPRSRASLDLLGSCIRSLPAPAAVSYTTYVRSDGTKQRDRSDHLIYIILYLASSPSFDSERI